MPLLETPALLILGSEAEYITRLREEYNTKEITIPEGKKVVFYLDSYVSCQHCFSGGKNPKFNPMRAQRLLWVKFLLENQSARIIKRSLQNGNIIFVCDELKYVVVCSVLPVGDLKFITQYVMSGDDAKKFLDPVKYEDVIFA